MSGISRLFAFIQNHISNNSDFTNRFQAFKEEVDTNNDDTIQIGELRNFIRNSSLNGYYTDRDINEVWNNLDTIKIGENTSSVQGVHENGSLDSNEQNSMVDMMEKYARIHGVIWHWTQTDSNYQNNIKPLINSDVVYHTVSDEIAKYNIDDLNNNAILEIAKDLYLKVIKNTVVNNALNYSGYANALSNLGLSGYSLASDSDLMNLINQEMSGVQTLDNLANINDRLDLIIKLYINTIKDGYFAISNNPANPVPEFDPAMSTNGYSNLQMALYNERINCLNKAFNWLAEFGGGKLFNNTSAGWQYTIDQSEFKSELQAALNSGLPSAIGEVLEFGAADWKYQYQLIALNLMKETMIKENCNLSKFAEVLSDLGLSSYKLEDDPDLMMLIEKEWERILGDNTIPNRWHLDEFRWKVGHVIVVYMKESGIQKFAESELNCNEWYYSSWSRFGEERPTALKTATFNGSNTSLDHAVFINSDGITITAGTVWTGWSGTAALDPTHGSEQSMYTLPATPDTDLGSGHVWSYIRSLGGRLRDQAIEYGYNSTQANKAYNTFLSFYYNACKVINSIGTTATAGTVLTETAPVSFTYTAYKKDGDVTETCSSHNQNHTGLKANYNSDSKIVTTFCRSTIINWFMKFLKWAGE